MTPGATSQSITIQIVDDSGLAVTGLVAATFPATGYERVAEASVGITLLDLAAITSLWSSGGVKEVGGGYYRLDVPNAAFATASRVRIIGEATAKHILYPPIEVAYSDVQTVADLADLANDYSQGLLDCNVNDLEVGSTAAAAFLDLANGIEAGVTPRNFFRRIAAPLLGINTGAGTGTEKYYAVANPGTLRVTYTIDIDGNRSAVTFS